VADERRGHENGAVTSTELTYDPYDPVIDLDPYDTWRRLRDEAPLYRNERLGFYALSRYDDVLEGLSDWRTYSSRRGTLLELIDPLAPEADGDPEGAPMIFTDPPYHDLLRGLVSRSFTPRRVGALEQRVRDLCREGFDAAGNRFDYVEDVAGPIPAMVIGEMLGVPAEDQRQLGRWTDQLMHYDPELETGDEILGMRQQNPVKLEGASNLWRYLEAAVDERTAHPGEDMISSLITAEITLEDGTRRRLSRTEVTSFFLLLFTAGSETTARLLGWSAVLLARHPDQRARLVEDRSLVPNAVEELLRYEAPSPIQARWVTRDVEVHGQVVPAGSKMALLNAAANRDERHFADPDAFDVGRSIDRHLSFGYGGHFCLGAALARLEGRVVLEETLDRFPTWEVDEDRVGFVRTTTVRGPAQVPFSVP
jgi:cytochrome P450